MIHPHIKTCFVALLPRGTAVWPMRVVTYDANAGDHMYWIINRYKNLSWAENG